MNVAVANHRLAMRTRPSLRLPVEIQQAGEHRVAFDDVEEIRVTIHHAAQRHSDRKERVRCDDEPARFPRDFNSRRSTKLLTRSVAGAEIQQQDVAAFYRPLDARNERDAAIGRVVDERLQVKLSLVKRNRQRVIPKLRGAIDQLIRGVRNVVDRIVRRVRMQIDFQHASGQSRSLPPTDP